MFKLNYETTITINHLPLQWIPKIELYYPDLPQFPIMYVHFLLDNKRIIACPVSVSYRIKQNYCIADFTILINEKPTPELILTLTDEISNRIGYNDQITEKTLIACCKGNLAYINVLTDLWRYIKKSYGNTIPYGRFYEEIYSIPRFVAAWQPKTGRQSEMRMLYNFMKAFGEEVNFPKNWNHLEYYVIPTYTDVRNKNYSMFPVFKKLYHSITQLFRLEFTNTISIDGINFNVLLRAWPKNKDDFITNITKKYYSLGKISEDDKYYAEKLVDAFNRHPWRAAFFISAFLNIENSDYRTWSKNFFKNFYNSGNKLKGYSQKVIACFLQQGFANKEIIPIDTWVETFYQYPLGIDTRSDFYDKFNMLGKLERVIWLASQANKTNMKNFFDILWCQRYGTIGNRELRGVNPIACSLCKLNQTCVGLSKHANDKILISNTLSPETFNAIPQAILNSIKFICLLEKDVPKKVYKKSDQNWFLIDEFSGYLMTNHDCLPKNIIEKKIITFVEFIRY